jgi:hypothetical protein
MRIAQVAPLAEAVPPKLYGGTERVVSSLTEELVAQGHEVTLFASGDSETSAKLVPCVPQGLRLAGIRDRLPSCPCTGIQAGPKRLMSSGVLRGTAPKSVAVRGWQRSIGGELLACDRLLMLSPQALWSPEPSSFSPADAAFVPANTSIARTIADPRLAYRTQAAAMRPERYF